MRGSVPRNSFGPAALEIFGGRLQAKELKFPEFKFIDFKIPQAVAYVLLISALASGQTAIPNSHPGTQDSKQQVESLLREFLSKVSDPAMHERFWADDV